MASAMAKVPQPLVWRDGRAPGSWPDPLDPELCASVHRLQPTIALDGGKPVRLARKDGGSGTRHE